MKLCGVSYPFESHLIGGVSFPISGYAHWLINIPRQVIKSRWWFEICSMLTHYLGKMNPFGLTIFQVGWTCWFNHQPDVVNPTSLTFHLPPFIINQRVFSRSVVVQSGQAAKMPCEVVWEVPGFPHSCLPKVIHGGFKGSDVKCADSNLTWLGGWCFLKDLIGFVKVIYF